MVSKVSSGDSVRSPFPVGFPHRTVATRQVILFFFMIVIILELDFASMFLQNSLNCFDFLRPTSLLCSAWCERSSEQSLSDLVDRAC